MRRRQTATRSRVQKQRKAIHKRAGNRRTAMDRIADADRDSRRNIKKRKAADVNREQTLKRRASRAGYSVG